MAAKISNQSGGGGREEITVSYASVLHPKTAPASAPVPVPVPTPIAVPKTDNNKENENSGAQHKNFNGDVAVTEVVKNGDVSDGEFRTVAPKSARRKEKLREKDMEFQRLREAKIRAHRIAENQERMFRERERDKERERERERCRDDSCQLNGGKESREKEKSEDGEQENGPVKYVEAPLPSVNPWMKSKAAARQEEIPAVINNSPVMPAVQAEAVNGHGPITPEKKEVEKERRVLQPQQQKVKAVVGELINFE